MSANRNLPILICLAALFALSACASRGGMRVQATAEAGQNLAAQFERVLQDSALVNAHVGVKVVSLQSGQTIYEKNSRRRFLPASNMKLFTTATALSRLGPNFRFRTILHADTASVHDSTIVGNLYLQGFGNPDLEQDDLRWLAQQLYDQGIRAVSGDLVCDATYFDDLYWGNGWMWDDGSYRDFTHISALSVNKNGVIVKVKPGAQIGDSLQVSLAPETSYLSIQNFGVTVDSTDTTRIEEFAITREWMYPENTIKVEGGLANTAKEQRRMRTVVRPALYTGTLFSQVARELGIRVQGTILAGAAPDTSVVLATHFSAPLSDAVHNTNKISDNLSAEMLLKTLGAELVAGPGTGKNGLSMVKTYLAEIGVDTLDLKIADGSGVSRYSLISPDHLISLLRAVHRNFQIQAEFQASLPIAGVDGTISRRMQGTPAEGKLRAKTGNLSGASCLSGYTTTADGELLAFSFMMDDFVAPNSEARRVQDLLGALISGMSLRAR